MHTPLNRLDADFYQLSGEDAEQEHIAASGALSVAGIYANHGNTLMYQTAIGDGDAGLDQTAAAYRPQMADSSQPASSENNYSSFSNALQNTAQQYQANSAGFAQAAEMIPTVLSMPAGGLSASVLGTLGNLMSSSLGGFGSNGSNGTNGTDGHNGNNGNNGSNGGHCPPPSGHECHGGDTNITIIDIDIDTTITNIVNNTLIDLNPVTNVVNNVINNVTGILQGGNTLIDIDILNNEHHTHSHNPLIDIDLGGNHYIGGNNNNVIDIGIGGNHTVIGNDNDIIDISLGGNHHVGGNDNDVLDLNLGGNHQVGGNDNDLIDLGLGGTSNIGGNDNDLIDLGLFNTNNVAGNDNDLISLGLNDHSTVSGSNNDVIGLDLNLLDNAGSQSPSGDLLGAGIELLNDNGLAGIDLNLGNVDVADVGLDQGGLSLDLDLVGLHLDSGDLLGHNASEGLLPDDLNIDLGLLDVLNTGLGQGDDGLLNALGLNNDPSHMSTSHGGGTVLGLQLGLGAWV